MSQGFAYISKVDELSLEGYLLEIWGQGNLITITPNTVCLYNNKICLESTMDLKVHIESRNIVADVMIFEYYNKFSQFNDELTALTTNKRTSISFPSKVNHHYFFPTFDLEIVEDPVSISSYRTCFQVGYPSIKGAVRREDNDHVSMHIEFIVGHDVINIMRSEMSNIIRGVQEYLL